MLNYSVAELRSIKTFRKVLYSGCVTSQKDKKKEFLNIKTKKYIGINHEGFKIIFIHDFCKTGS